MLKVHPNKRPSCAEILKYPWVQARLNERMLIETVERNPELMKTILLPKNLHYLTDVLPKPNYKPL